MTSVNQSDVDAQRAIARKWERRTHTKQQKLNTVNRSLDAAIETLDRLSDHLSDLRNLINEKETS